MSFGNEFRHIFAFKHLPRLLLAVNWLISTWPLTGRRTHIISASKLPVQWWAAAVVQYGGMPLHEHCSAHYGGDKIPTVKQTGKLWIVGKKWQNPKIFVRYFGVFEILDMAKCPLLSDWFTPYPVGQQQNVRYSGFVRYFWSPLNWSFTVLYYYCLLLLRTKSSNKGEVICFL